MYLIQWTEPKNGFFYKEVKFPDNFMDKKVLEKNISRTDALNNTMNDRISVKKIILS